MARTSVRLAALFLTVMLGPAQAAALPGRSLALRERPGGGDVGRTMRLAGDLAGWQPRADPTRDGAVLRLRARDGAGFDAVYPLPASGWRRRGDAFAFTGPAPVRRAVLWPGHVLEVVARGPGLAHRLAAFPEPVDVVLHVGQDRLCFRFAGGRYRTGRSWTAGPSAAPPSCADDDTWPMHVIADAFRGANGLHAGDVDGDGLADWATNYEFDQAYTIAFHPGFGPAVRRAWPRVTAFQPPKAEGQGVNPESIALGDVDGDGALDVIAAQGWSSVVFFDGSQPGVRIVWGPGPAAARDPGAWIDAGRIPATVDFGHYLWVRPLDVDGDGATDIVAGGRVHGGNGRRTGPQWIQAPTDPAQRRDLARWVVHEIDPAQWDGHGFVFADVDGDGDPDLVDANADFDTPEAEETVHWYENPGPGTAAERGPWPKHEIYRGAEFSAKPQVTVADLDGDGREDVLTQVADAVYWFRKTGLAPVTFERIVIPKPAVTRAFSRPLRVADMNGDGRLDLVGGLSHEDGVLPASQYSVFWMEHAGNPADPTGWRTHPIRWGSGRTMLIPVFGEKWDQMELVDVDGDGDLDVIANCEEWWENAGAFEALAFYDPSNHPSSVSVVWFENRLADPPRGCRERDGLCVVEAEAPTVLRDGTWVERGRFPGFVGDGYMHVHNAAPLAAPLAADGSEGLAYTMALDGGTYRLWARRWVPSVWGYGHGGARSDSAWILIDDALAGVLGDDAAPTDAWRWVPLGAPLVLPPGSHTVRVRAREHGVAIDRLLLARDATLVPSGAGPAAVGW